MMKKVLSILVAVVVLFALCACNGSELTKKIDELEKVVQSQTDKITELEEKNKQQSDRVSELEEQNRGQAGKIENLEERVEELELELKMQTSIHSGKFCSLVEAYESGWLTQDDIRNIACFHGGNTVTEGQISDIDTWHEVEFVPTKKESFLSNTAQNNLKEAYAYYLRNNNENYLNLTAESVYFYDYYGTYNNCVVARIFARRDSTGGMIYSVNYPVEEIRLIAVGGIILSYEWPDFVVWKME